MQVELGIYHLKTINETFVSYVSILSLPNSHRQKLLSPLPNV